MKKLPIQFNLIGISTEQYAILDEQIGEDKSKWVFESSVKVGAEPKSNVVSIVLKIVIEDGEKPFLVNEIQCNFGLTQDSWDELKNESNENEISIPKGFLSHLVVITIGTMRGSLFAKTEKLIKGGIVLPTININDWFEEDLVFTLDETN